MRRARASCAFVAGCASGSESAARWQSASLIASKARQSLLGGFFGSNLNFVIFPLFMRLRSSRGYDADDVASHRVANEEHSAVDQADGVEAQPAVGIAFVKFNQV